MPEDRRTDKYGRPLTISEPMFNGQGFGVGFRITHPGSECVFPEATDKQCSCGRMDLGVVKAPEPEESEELRLF